MKSAIHSFWLSIGILLLGTSSIQAQDQEDEAQVAAANQAFYESISQEDMTWFETLWAHEPYVRAVHPVSLEVEKGWETVRGTFQNVFDWYDNIDVSMPEPQIRLGDRIAWVTGEEAMSAQHHDSGEAFSVTLLGTNVFEKVGERWLMVHHHVSKAATPEE